MEPPCFFVALNLWVAEWLSIQSWKKQSEDNPKGDDDDIVMQFNEVGLKFSNELNSYKNTQYFSLIKTILIIGIAISSRRSQGDPTNI